MHRPTPELGNRYKGRATPLYRRDLGYGTSTQPSLSSPLWLEGQLAFSLLLSLMIDSRLESSHFISVVRKFYDLIAWPKINCLQGPGSSFTLVEAGTIPNAWASSWLSSLDNLTCNPAQCFQRMPLLGPYKLTRVVEILEAKCKTRWATSPVTIAEGNWRFPTPSVGLKHNNNMVMDRKKRKCTSFSDTRFNLHFETDK